ALGKRLCKNVIADVTPGGGKSRLATNFAKKLMEEHVVKHVIWGCPRAALVDQALESWEKAGLASSRLTPIWYGNMAARIKELVDRCKNQPTLFIADELQFLADYQENKNGTWDNNARAILDSCNKYLGVSGTLFSSKGLRLLGVTYLSAEDMRLRNPSMSELYRGGKSYPDADIRYDLRQALEDQVVAPYKIVMDDIEFKPKGVEDTFRLDDPESQEYNSLLQDILERENYWKPNVDRMIEEWKTYRRNYYNSNAIIVAASQDHAARIVNHLRVHNVHGLLAISSESDMAKENIQIVKEMKFDAKPRVLVTVAMAAVGLDVPHLTHMSYLNHYRFWGFVLQAWARVSRICYDCGLSAAQQMAYIYTTNDYRMADFVEWIKKQHPVGKMTDGCGGGDPGEPPSRKQDKSLDSCKLVGNSYETSNDNPGYYGEQADVISAVTSLIPDLASVPASVALAVAPHLDANRTKQSKVSVKKETGRASSHVAKTAYRRGLTAIANRISKATEEEVQFVRMRLQNNVTISVIEKDVKMLKRVFLSACSEASRFTDSINLYWGSGKNE
ncbi:MAG: hypothetical protein EBX40_06860, partial [Gammaproteobacteria bacterium]|nr:hypothetical protein [Gammaproteobacteria bacterium]